MNKKQGLLLRIKRSVPIAYTSGTNCPFWVLYGRYKVKKSRKKIPKEK